MNESNALSRRSLIQGLAALSAMPLNAMAAEIRPKQGALPWVPGLQLYTLQLKTTDDLQAALNEVAATGYRLVELAGNYGKSAAEFKRMLDAAGLEAPSCHVSPGPASTNWDLTGDLPKLAADMHTLGAQHVVLPIPLLPQRAIDALRHPPPGGFNPKAVSNVFEELTEEDWNKSADLLNDKAAALAREGLRMGYHNHGIDFKQMPSGKTGFDIMVKRVDAKLVDFEIDIGWAAAAGQDIGALFKRLGPRLGMLHLKDVRQRGAVSMELIPADAGTGIVNWHEVLDLVRHSSVEYMFVEHEPPFVKKPMDAAKADFSFLSKLFGVAQK
jgi:sugar phosphate isomerase/epimerase